jgi:hypothetical protein
MQVVVAIKLWGYMDTNMLNKGKKRDEIIDYYFENNMFYNRKLKKIGGGGSDSMPHAPAIINPKVHLTLTSSLYTNVYC